MPLSNEMKPGFYLIRKSDNARFFISNEVDVNALDRVARSVLNPKVGFDYWIDRYMGLDVTGRQAWGNLDWTEHFIDKSVAMCA